VWLAAGAAGELLCVLPSGMPVAAVACDAQGGRLVLLSATGAVRVFGE